MPTKGGGFDHEPIKHALGCLAVGRNPLGLRCSCGAESSARVTSEQLLEQGRKVAEEHNKDLVHEIGCSLRMGHGLPCSCGAADNLFAAIERKLHPNWQAIAEASYGNEWSDPPTPKICVVATRYGGGYEGGRFAAIPVGEIDGSAFGQDLDAAAWWDKHEAEVGVGRTPDAALIDWHAKRARMKSLEELRKANPVADSSHVIGGLTCAKCGVAVGHPAIERVCAFAKVEVAKDSDFPFLPQEDAGAAAEGRNANEAWPHYSHRLSCSNCGIGSDNAEISNPCGKAPDQAVTPSAAAQDDHFNLLEFAGYVSQTAHIGETGEAVVDQPAKGSDLADRIRKYLAWEENPEFEGCGHVPGHPECGGETCPDIEPTEPGTWNYADLLREALQLLDPQAKNEDQGSGITDQARRPVILTGLEEAKAKIAEMPARIEAAIREALEDQPPPVGDECTCQFCQARRIQGVEDGKPAILPEGENPRPLEASIRELLKGWKVGSEKPPEILQDHAIRLLQGDPDRKVTAWRFPLNTGGVLQVSRWEMEQIAKGDQGPPKGWWADFGAGAPVLFQHKPEQVLTPEQAGGIAFPHAISEEQAERMRQSWGLLFPAERSTPTYGTRDEQRDRGCAAPRSEYTRPHSGTPCESPHGRTGRPSAQDTERTFTKAEVLNALQHTSRVDTGRILDRLGFTEQEIADAIR